MGGEETSECNEVLIRYLQSWGLREFRDEASYYEWQRSTLSEEELRRLNRLIEQRHGGEQVDCDLEFYNVSARRDLVSVLYSQRFHYFLTIGSSVSSRISPATHVLDFGCGVGILTLFYAQQHPSIEFVGIDRSHRSIELACLEAEQRQLANIRFLVSQTPQYPLAGDYDLILSTQALFQAEREPGLPSQSWSTFQREDNPHRQAQIEIRTGLGGRLDTLLSALRPKGRMIVFEKTWHLGRRIFFQRALGERGLWPISAPVPYRYRSLDEEVNDGPLYELTRLPEGNPSLWNEEPFRESGETLYRCVGLPAARMGQELVLNQVLERVSGIHGNIGSWSFRFGLWNQVLVWALYENSLGFTGLVIGGGDEKELLLQLVKTLKQIEDADLEHLIRDFWADVASVADDPSVPCFESHHPSAQTIYKGLPSKNIQQESTFQDGEGKEMHIELGTTKNFTYLYWANVFDQRQLVLMDSERAHLLTAYYRESLVHPQDPPA